MSTTAIVQRNGRNGRNGHDTLPRGALLDVNGKVLNAQASITAFPLLPGGTGYGHYGASFRKNSMLGWQYHGGDPDRDIGLNVQTLRERSRDAFMGIPLAAGAIETLDTNVIGEGLFPAPNVDGEMLGLTPEKTAALNKEIAKKFRWWANDPREVDYEGKHSFYMLQHIAYQSSILSGDCPVLLPLVPRSNTVFELRLRVLEADRIMNPHVLVPGANLFSGVELGSDGQLVAYHIANKHPLAAGFGININPGSTVRVEPFGQLSGRRNMILLIRPERPEQRRGVPILSVCLELLKQQGRHIDATVVAAVIQSYFTAFITSEFPDPDIFDGLLTEDQKKQIADLNPYNVELGPGIVNFMRPGHKVDFANPTQPLATFGDFTIAVAKFVGAALGIPYEVLLKQYNASYSASRAALLDFWRRVRKHRAQVIDQFCQPIYEEWLTDAVSLGRIELFPGGFDDPAIRKAMLGCIWTGSSAGSLDPAKEVMAADLKVKCGFSTTERESMELNGSNYRDNISQQSLEKAEFESADLLFPPYRLTGDAPAVETKPAGAGQPSQVGPGKPANRIKPLKRELTEADLASGISGVFIR
jgi:lambda family phage portal protein